MSTKNNVAIEKIGDRIKSFRIEKQLTLVQLSDLIGISHGSLSGLENNKSKPSAETLSNFCLHTDIDIEWLLTGEERTKSMVQLEDEPKGGRKFDIINEVEEWLGEEVRRNPKKEIWFEIEMQESFSSFEEWKRKRDQQKSGEYTGATRKVA